MDRLKHRVSTTHVDLHNERMAKQALDEMMSRAAEAYIPLLWNHDIRFPPLGRIVSAEVVAIGDGEFALDAVSEMWDGTEAPGSLRGDGRRMVLDLANPDVYRIVYDRSFRTPEGLALVADLAQIAGPKSRPVESGKKALDPISTLTIAAGAFVLGSVATGFFGRLGGRIYEALEKRLAKHFGAGNSRETLLDFQLTIDAAERSLDAHVLLDTPNVHDIELLFERGFAQLDPAVADTLSTENDVVRVVFEWRDGALRLRYAVRSDAVPVLVAPQVYEQLTERIAQAQQIGESTEGESKPRKKRARRRRR